MDSNFLYYDEKLAYVSASKGFLYALHVVHVNVYFILNGEKNSNLK